MSKAERVLATAGPTVRRHLATAGLLAVRWLGATVKNASVIALVMLVFDALDASRRLAPLDPGHRLRWILLVSVVGAVLGIGARNARGKQVGSTDDAT